MKKIIILSAAALIFIMCFSDAIYMRVKLGDKRIGWYEYSSSVKNTLRTVEEKARMEMSVYDKDVSIDAYTMSVFDSLNSLVKMFVSVQNQFFSIYVNGYVKGGFLIISTVSGDGIFYDTIDIRGKRVIFNAESIDEGMAGASDLFMFNPLSRRLESVKIEKAGEEAVDYRGKKVKASKYLMSGPTLSEAVYFTPETGIIMSVSLTEGVVMERTDSIESRFDATELINLFSVEAEGDFGNIRKADKARYIIESTARTSLSEYRQEQKGDTLTVWRTPVFIPESLSSGDTSFVSYGEGVKAAAKEIIKKAGADKERQIYFAIDYVFKKLKQEIFPGLIMPEEILKRGGGDCTEHAQLYAAIMRAMGFDCDIVSGLVYMDGAFYYHAWNRVKFKGRIYTIDSTFNQKDADVSHIMLSAGFPPNKVLINSIAEKVRIKRIKQDAK